jgi:hypothetical protein
MKRKLLVNLFLGALVLSVVYISYQVRLTKKFEQEIFCDRLQTGMSEEEVIGILEEYGEIVTGGAPIGATYEIPFSFVDGRINGRKLIFLRGTYNLTFWEGSYDDTYYMVGLDQVGSPCE